MKHLASPSAPAWLEQRVVKEAISTRSALEPRPVRAAWLSALSWRRPEVVCGGPGMLSPRNVALACFADTIRFSSPAIGRRARSGVVPRGTSDWHCAAEGHTPWRRSCASQSASWGGAVQTDGGGSRAGELRSSLQAVPAPSPLCLSKTPGSATLFNPCRVGHIDRNGEPQTMESDEMGCEAQCAHGQQGSPNVAKLEKSIENVKGALVQGRRA